MTRIPTTTRQKVSEKCIDYSEDRCSYYNSRNVQEESVILTRISKMHHTSLTNTDIYKLKQIATDGIEFQKRFDRLLASLVREGAPDDVISKLKVAMGV